MNRLKNLRFLILFMLIIPVNLSGQETKLSGQGTSPNQREGPSMFYKPPTIDELRRSGVTIIDNKSRQEQIQENAQKAKKSRKKDSKKDKESQEKIKRAIEAFESKTPVPGEKGIDFMQPFPKISLNSASFRGRLIDSKTNLPVCYAEICCNDLSAYIRSNDKGEFQFSSPEFPALLKIRKLGYEEKIVHLTSPETHVSISLTPLEITRKSDYRVRLQYASLLKTAAEKLRVDPISQQDHSQRELVYCRIISSADSTINSLFESYANMNASKYSLLGFQSEIARYVPARERIPGISGNRLAFNIDPFVRMPNLAYLERFVKNQGSFEQDGNRIAIASLKSGENETIYYIRVADTTVVYIKRYLVSGKKNKTGEGEPIWLGNRNNTTEISFPPSPENRSNSRIDFITDNEAFQLIQKDKPTRQISKSTLYAVIPDSSQINNAAKEYLFKESMTRPNQQINYNAAYSLSKKSALFDSEVQKLLLKPYSSSFWDQNSLIATDSVEQKQIQRWENDGRFYSENRLSPATKITSADSLVKKLNKVIIPVENVYLELDRSDYLAGDTIWFSAFVLDNLQMDSTFLSKVLYVDLINPENRLEKQLKLFIKNGRSKGDFTLGKELKNAVFRVRAYTQWMRNFQSEYFFEKDIPVYQSNVNNLIAINPVIDKFSGGDSVSLFLKVLLPPAYKSLDKKLDVNIRLNDSVSFRKSFPFRDEFHDVLGFFVPASLGCSSADLKMTLSDTAFISEQRLSVPLKSGIDLQFFPESGKMVDGISSVIAYKAVDNKGNPAEIEADVVDENQNVIAHFAGNKSGVGKFRFTPNLNHTFKAIVNSSGNKYLFKLPVTEPTGYVLSFNASSSSITIQNNQNPNQSKHYILVSVRGAVYHAIELKLVSGLFSLGLPFKKYPKGIVQITLTDSLYRPLAERLVFNNPSDRKMLIRVETDKKEYTQKEKVNLSVKVTDAAGNPIESSLTMAVVDGAKSDSLKSFADIESYLYLASELKGKIDYQLLNLADTSAAGIGNVDFVMMTQGWRNYLWNSIRYSNSLKDRYPNEKGFYITGTVSDYNSRMTASDYSLNFFDDKTGFNDVVRVNEKGGFKVAFPYFYNTHDLIIQNRNRKGRVDDIRFTLDTVPLPGINFRNNELPYLSYKPGYLKAIDDKIAENDSLHRDNLKHILLPEFTITAKTPRRNLTPNKIVDLNQTDPTGKKYSSLMQMIREQFGEKAFLSHRGRPKSPVLVINGNPCLPWDLLYGWFMSRPINEISNVRFYEAGSDYSQSFGADPGDLPLIISFLPIISMTAYEDSYRGDPKGAVVLPFQGFYQAKEFYQPNYETNKSDKVDNRTTIYWNPEVNTDSTGKANISFYNSDLKGRALIKISGVSYQLKDASAAVSNYESK